MRDGVERDGAPTKGTGGVPGVPLSVAALFTLLWDALADLLGTATAAVLLRRSAQRATRHCPELAELVVVREGLEYRYSLPAAWHTPTGEAHAALRGVVVELLPLLAALTGSVAARHLAQVRGLRDAGLISPQEEQT